MSFPAFVWYVFSCFNTWSRIPRFGSQVDRPTQFYSLHIQRPTLFYPSPGQPNLNLLQSSLHTVTLAVCNDTDDVTLFMFEFTDDLGNIIDEIRSENCAVKWKAPNEGVFQLKVKGQQNGLVVKESTTKFKVVDYWVAALGDSFASGEGNPDIPAFLSMVNKAQWISNYCHRSQKAWPFKVFQRLQSLTRGAIGLHFTFTACSGASVDSGPYSILSQANNIANLTKSRGRGPELLMLTAGGNDIGYSHILQSLLEGDSIPQQNLELRLLFVSHQFDRLATVIKEGVDPGQVVIPTYFDFAQNEKKQVDVSCSDLERVSVENLQYAQNEILTRLNRMIIKKSKRFRWNAVAEATNIFDRGGICSSASLIRSTDDSIRLQGDSGGAFHPTEDGHKKLANLVFSNIHFRKLLTDQHYFNP